MSLTNAEPIQETLDKVMEHLEEEARMVLPGIQALFGFQLVAVFNQRFDDLSSFVQSLHFAALLLTALAMLFVLTPAAYHRQAEPRQISDRLCRIGSFFLTISLLPLAVGISFEIYVIGELLKFSEVATILFSTAALLSLLTAWFLFPIVARFFFKASKPKSHRSPDSKR